MYSARCPGKTTRSRSQPSHVEGPETKSVCLCNLSSQDGLGSWSGRTSPKPMKAKKKHLKVTLKRQATYLECGCSSCFCLAYCHTIPHARKKYPKCTALAGCSSLHPPGFKTIEDAFKWPHIFCNGFPITMVQSGSVSGCKLGNGTFPVPSVGLEHQRVPSAECNGCFIK